MTAAALAARSAATHAATESYKTSAITASHRLHDADGSTGTLVHLRDSLRYNEVIQKYAECAGSKMPPFTVVRYLCSVVWSSRASLDPPYSTLIRIFHIKPFRPGSKFEDEFLRSRT